MDRTQMEAPEFSLEAFEDTKTPRPLKDQLRKRLASASEETVPVTITFETGEEVSYRLPADLSHRWMFTPSYRETAHITEVRIG